MKTELGKYIGLAIVAGISLTCDSNTKKLSSTIQKPKSEIEKILTIPTRTHTPRGGNTKHIGDITSQNIRDTLILWDVGIQQDKTIKDTINKDTITTYIDSNNTDCITNKTQGGPNENSPIVDMLGKENIKYVRSKEECKILLNKQITKAIVEIIPETERIKFDLIYMRGEAHTLFTHFFIIQDTPHGTNLVFSTLQQDDKIFVTQHMDNMKTHIKAHNGFFIKLLLNKGDLKDYIMNGSEKPKKDEKSNIEKLYEIITNKGSLKYEGDEGQFQKDIESVINLYK